ncbi:MAG: hypothetical protein ACK4LT_04790 [Aquificaceae bacterium]
MKKYLLVLFLFSAGCGIKATPEVLKEPEVVIKRIGDKVYVRSVSGEVRIKGFEKVGSYWIKENKEAFCFSVERIGGRSRKFCVGKAIEEKPLLRVEEERDFVEVIPLGFEAYRLYTVKEGSISLEEAKEFKESIKLERDYWERCYAIVGVKGALESSPVEFCTKPKPPPTIKEVENLEVRVGESKLYLVWFYKEGYKEFVIYQNGREIGRTTGFAFEVPPPEGKATFTVKVINPLGFESKGVSVDYSP